MSGKGCVFCGHEQHRARIVCESGRFYAIPTVGQISDGGHMLIIPKGHHVCLGAMDDAHFDEFEAMHADLKRRIRASYGKRVVSFEHGILGQSVPHGHLQVLPSDTDLYGRISQDFKLVKPLGSVREIRELHRTKGVYLFYENQQDDRFGFLLDSFPQYLRIVAAECIGKPQRGNWREWRADPLQASLDDRLIDETVQKLRQA
jgi:diadenosine tetraphosphate (Ap4A) HIT family hydrolase